MYVEPKSSQAKDTFENLMDIVIDTLSPSDETGRAAGRMILNNKKDFDIQFSESE